MSPQDTPHNQNLACAGDPFRPLDELAQPKALRVAADLRRCRSVPDLLRSLAQRDGDQPFLFRRIGNTWRSKTAGEAWTLAQDVAARLRRDGVQPGDRVALLSENRPEWIIAANGIMLAGAVLVPLYPTYTLHNHAHVLGDSQARACIVSGKALALPLFDALAGKSDKSTPKLTKLYAFESLDGSPPPPGLVADVILGGLFDDAPDHVQALLPLQPSKGDNKGANVADPEVADLAALYYTSGTGGDPVGVMLTHSNFLANLCGILPIVAVLPPFEKVKTIRFLSYLPLCHCYEFVAGMLLPTSIGGQVWFARSIDKLSDDAQEARPHLMSAVPRVFEVLKRRIEVGIRSAPKLRQKLFAKTVELGLRVQDHQAQTAKGLSPFASIINAILTRVVRRKAQGRFGGELYSFISGGAPLQQEVGCFFKAIGFRIIQGYGQTESSPVISVNRPGAEQLETVGPPLPGVKVRIADNGEILVRGPSVMRGYWRLPEKTAATLKGGWLHTGDIGEISPDGHLRITDRLRDIIVNSGGDNIAPQRVEGILALEPEIAFAAVFGDQKSHLAGVICPDPDTAEEVKRRAVDQGRDETNDLRDIIHAALDRANRKLSRVEQVRRFHLAPEPFAIENGLLTSSMKVRRFKVRERYQAEIDLLWK